MVSGTNVDIGITFEYEKLEISKIIVSSQDYEGTYKFDIYSNNQRCLDWADYFIGAIEGLKKSQFTSISTPMILYSNIGIIFFRF